MTLSPSQGVACSLRADRCQVSATWRAFHRLRLPPQDLDLSIWRFGKIWLLGLGFIPFFLATCSVCGARGRVSSCESVLLVNYSSSGAGLHLSSSAIGLWLRAYKSVVL